MPAGIQPGRRTRMNFDVAAFDWPAQDTLCPGVSHNPGRVTPFGTSGRRSLRIARALWDTRRLRSHAPRAVEMCTGLAAADVLSSWQSARPAAAASRTACSQSSRSSPSLT